MPRNRALSVAAVIPMLLAIAGRPARAAIVFPDPGRITTEPTGDLAGSGWQYEGSLGGVFAGTAIAPDYFLTARHVPGGVGSPILFDGKTYVADRVAVDPDADLAIYHIDPAVNGVFPRYAPLYANSDEVGQHLVFFGRSGPRADPVVVGGQLRGWRFGDPDLVQSWGENTVSSVLDRGGTVGPLLTWTFDANAAGTGGALPFEGHLVGFDSGGGVFLRDPADGLWKLAGVNQDLDSPYKTAPDGPIFDAALFDQRGLYVLDKATGQYVLVPDGPDPVGGRSYATRISANLAFIRAALAVPEPGSLALLIVGGGWAMTTWRRREE